jgi:hypothetical protein
MRKSAGDLGFSKIVTIRELAKPQAIPGRDDHVTYIYLSGMALGNKASKSALILTLQHREVPGTFL